MSFVVLTAIRMMLHVFGNFFILRIVTADPNICTPVSSPSVMELVL